MPLSNKTIFLIFKSTQDLSDLTSEEIKQYDIISSITLCAEINPLAQRKIHFYLYENSGVHRGAECHLNKNFDAIMTALFSDYGYFRDILFAKSYNSPFPKPNNFANFIISQFDYSFNDLLSIIINTTYERKSMYLEFEKYIRQADNDDESWLAKKMREFNNKACPTNMEWGINFLPSNLMPSNKFKAVDIEIYNSKTKRFPCVANEFSICDFSKKLQDCLKEIV